MKKPEDILKFLEGALKKITKLDIKNPNYYVSNLLLQEFLNTHLGLYSIDNNFGYILYNDLEALDEHNTYNILLKEYVYLNISKYFNISFIEYINIPIRQKNAMVKFASKLIEEENTESQKQKKDIEDAINVNTQQLKVNNGQLQ